MKKLLKKVIFVPATVWLCLALPANAGERLHSVVIENPRAYGYHVGDSITQELHIKYATDMELRVDGLPKVGNVTPWIKLEKINIDESISDESKYSRVTLDYQISGFTQGENSIDTPQFNLSVEKGNEKLPIVIHGTSLYISRLSEPIDSNLSNVKLADPLGPTVKSPALYRYAKWIAFLFGIGLIGWTAYRYLSQRKKWAIDHPFSAAYKQIKLLSNQSGDNSLQARRVLHAAFNQQFGRTLFESGLNQFFDQHVDFKKEESSIRMFFKDSQTLFFAKAGADNKEQASNSSNQVSLLAKRCRSFEKRATE